MHTSVPTSPAQRVAPATAEDAVVARSAANGVDARATEDEMRLAVVGKRTRAGADPIQVEPVTGGGLEAVRGDPL
jgi:hypothetical protein